MNEETFGHETLHIIHSNNGASIRINILDEQILPSNTTTPASKCVALPSDNPNVQIGYYEIKPLILGATDHIAEEICTLFLVQS